MSKIEVTKDVVDHVIYLRELSLKLIRECGQWEKVGATPVMCLKGHGNLSITYLTPFQRHGSEQERLDYGLEVKRGRGVVLSLSWKDGVWFCVHKYQPGVWESKLEASRRTVNIAA